jgi:hypothetical protein
MGWGELALAAIAAASAMYTGYSANQAAEQQSKAQKEAAAMQEAAGVESKRVAEENAVRIEQEGEESQRRLDEKMKQEEATGRARAAASGAVWTPEDENSSLATVIKSQADENKRQLSWERRATASQAALTRSQGDYAQRSAYAQAKATRKGAQYTAKGGKAALIGGVLGAGKAAGQGAYSYNAATVDPNTGQGAIETWWNSSGTTKPKDYTYNVSD